MHVTQQYYFDTLPVHPQPMQHESLTSYITRLASCNGITSITELSMALYKYQGLIGRKHLLDYPFHNFGLITSTTGCTDDALRKMTFYHLLHKVGRLSTPQAMSRFLSGSVEQKLRYCPLCVAQYGCYYLTWRFTTLSSCIDHACRLLVQCDHCKQPMPLFAVPSKIGMCLNCKGDIRMCVPEPVSPEELKIAKGYVADLHFLLDSSPVPKDDKTVARDIGCHFRYLRRTHRLSVPSVVKQAGLTLNDVLGIESGNFAEKGAYFSSYVKYATFFGLTLRDVIEPSLTTGNNLMPPGGLFSV